MARPAQKPIPEGYHTITPHLVIRGATRAIDFYRAAFGAEELFRMPGPDGRIMHAELRIGDSRVMLSDEDPAGGAKAPDALGGTTGALLLYVADVDTWVDRAVKAGAKVTAPVADMFWGDRYGRIQDPFGHSWALATHKEDLTPEEMRQRAGKAH